MLTVKQIIYTRSVLKALRMPANTVKLIVAKVKQYPAVLANKVTALKGREGKRC